MVTAEVFYSYVNLLIKMMRVHENGFVKNINNTHELYSDVPPEKRATITVSEFPVALFRWAWLNFIARQTKSDTGRGVSSVDRILVGRGDKLR